MDLILPISHESLAPPVLKVSANLEMEDGAMM